ncbi:MAG: PH domain-containing protein [Vicinamibacteria bacterium]|nr:PH domain-containing protein [Vicinamibacteria bacterium]
MTSDHRLHPASFLFSIGARLRQQALPIVVLLFSAGSVGFGWQIWLLLALVPYTLIAIARTLTFRYRYDEHELVIRTGLVARNERHVPYARIQNVDGVQTVFHRLLKVVDVKVQTAGGNEPEATMSVLPVAAFEQMRQRVFEGRSRAQLEPTSKAEAGDVPAAPRAKTLLALSPKDLLTYGFVEGRGMVVIAAVFGLVWEFGMADSFVPSFEPGKPPVPTGGAFRGLARSVYSRAEDLFTSLAIAAVTIVALLVVVRLVSMVWAMLRLHGFRLIREGEDLRTEYGLLTRVAATIPLRRIQTLTLREGPLHRLVGRISARVDTAGGEAGQNAPPDRHWLAPIVERHELPALLAQVLPVLALDRLEWQSVHPGALRRILKKKLLVSLLICLPLARWFGWWGLSALVVLIPWSMVSARWSASALGWAVTDELVAFRSGWLWRQTTVAPFARVQAVMFHESPFDRRNQMAGVRVDTAGAGDLSHRVAIPYLGRDDAQRLWRRVAHEAAGRSFRWS